MLRKLVSSERPRSLADLRGMAELAIDASPLAPVRSFWTSFRELEAWWPVLIPLLLWVFWRTYQRERASLLSGGDEAGSS